ncbi:hypothetical protein ERO13_A03G023350v2 [Gossypium hirsutum]|nr:hypothetical protein ERO13_A03G023350v2 [Gossypium hirsutum]
MNVNSRNSKLRNKWKCDLEHCSRRREQTEREKRIEMKLAWVGLRPHRACNQSPIQNISESPCMSSDPMCRYQKNGMPAL